nr:unnamed protein product [Callosobruchus chinensis]
MEESMALAKYRQIILYQMHPWFLGLTQEVPEQQNFNTCIIVSPNYFLSFGIPLSDKKNIMWRPATIFSRPPSLRQCGPPGNSNHC